MTAHLNELDSGLQLHSSGVSQSGGFFFFSLNPAPLQLMTGRHRGTHSAELLPESLSVLVVLQLDPTLVPLGLGEGLGEPLHLGGQLPRIPLQLHHLALPLGLAAIELQPQLMLALLQFLHRKDSGQSMLILIH